MTENGEEWLDRSEVAALLGVTPDSVTKYLANARHKGDQRTAGDMPEPDDIVATRHPRWKRSTIDAYRAARPGKGAPGRPRQRPGGVPFIIWG